MVLQLYVILRISHIIPGCAGIGTANLWGGGGGGFGGALEGGGF